MRFFKFALLTMAASLSACGTTYIVPELDESSTGKAQAMFAEAQRVSRPALQSEGVGMQRFRRVSSRVKPVAESLCQRETATANNFNCNVEIGVDTKMNQRNAYFTYADPYKKQKPMIFVTVPMLRDVQNDDELAFVLSHEYGHLIARHIEKKEQQALAGALILGSIAVIATANNPYADPDLISDNVNAGYALGSIAYSQEYELESDTLGTLIARSAGYDPVRGARYFARGEASRDSSDRLSFWGTHPPDEKRLATVIATVRKLDADGSLARKK